MTRALLIEPQAMFAPYFANVLAAAGLEVTTVKRAPKRFSRAAEPGVVVYDATGRRSEPLATIRALRRSLPLARIVLFARSDEAIWNSIATAVGADVVIDAQASETELIAALS